MSPIYQQNNNNNEICVSNDDVQETHNENLEQIQTMDIVHIFENKTVLHIGDSQVAGPYGYFLGRLIIEKGRASNYHRQGERGKGVLWWLNHGRLQRVLNLYHPDIVIVTMGGNDTWRARYRKQSYEVMVNNFINIIKEHTNDFVWVSPPTAVGKNSYRQQYRDIVTEIIHHHMGHNFIDSREITAIIDGRTPDGVHFTRSGGEEWANFQIIEIARTLAVNININ